MTKDFTAIAKIYKSLTAILLTALSTTTAYAAAPPSAYDMVKPATFTSVELSPSGRYLAYLMVAHEKYCFDGDGQMVDLDKGTCGEAYKRYRSTHQIKVYDLDSSTIVTTTQLPKNMVIDWLEWASEDRILASLRSPRTTGSGGYGQVFGTLGTDQRRFSPGASRVVSFPREGGTLTPLFEGNNNLVRQNQYMSQITNMLRDDPDHILMPANNSGSLDLWKVNITTGKAQVIEAGRSNTFHWFTDKAGVPTLRFDCKNARCLTINVFAKNKSGDWKSFKTFKRKPNETTDDFDFWPIAPSDSDGQFYVITREDDSERRAIALYDIST